jgi:hypothetical protein
MKSLRYIFLVVDIGFILYWLVTALQLLPAEYLYTDYNNPILVAWNWSFMPLDLLVSASGLYSIYLWKRKDSRYTGTALLSLAFTTASGLQAISFWTIRQEFDLMWWIPNLFLLIYPWFYIPRLVKHTGDE